MEYGKQKQFQYVRTIKDNTVSKIDEYEHPSSVLQLSLEALCVEINTLKATPWKMPLAIKENVAILSRLYAQWRGGKRICVCTAVNCPLRVLEQVLDQDTYQNAENHGIKKIAGNT